jgi:hypothetical protein
MMAEGGPAPSTAPTSVTSCHGVAQGTGLDSPTVNCTGANFIVASYTNYSAAACSAQLIDSSGNTWTPMTNYPAGGSGTVNGCLWYVCNPTLSSTYHIQITGTVVGAVFQGFRNVATTACLDGSQFNGAKSSTPVSTGSITPGQSGNLIVVGAASDTAIANAMSVSGGALTWAVTDFVPLDNGVAAAVGLAWAVQPVAASINPSVTLTGGTDNVAYVASFKHQ